MLYSSRNNLIRPSQVATMRKLIPDNKTTWNRVLSSPLASWRSILSILVVGCALLIGHEVSAQRLPAPSTSEVISSEATISVIGPVDPLPFAPAIKEARVSCANTESSCVEAWARVVDHVVARLTPHAVHPISVHGDCNNFV